MATITNAFTTASAKGLREDLTDEIHRVDVEDTPFTSMIETTTAKAVLHEWQTESLEAPDTANARPEGNETARAAGNPTVRVSNICQISDENATVSGTLEAVDKAGRNVEMAKQMTQKTIKLRRSIEAIILGNQAFSNASPRTTRSMEAWIRTNTSRGSLGADPADPNVTAGTTATDGTQRAFTVDLLKAGLQKVYVSGGSTKVALMGPKAKEIASGFAGRTGTSVNVGLNQIQGAADMYASDWGTIKFEPHRYMRGNGRTVFLLDPSKIRLAFLPGRKYHRFSLAKIGDAETKQIVCEYTLEMGNEKAHGVIADLLTA